MKENAFLKIKDIQTKKQHGFGAPPPPKAKPNLLSAPEVAPAGQIDGRSLRATGRTEQLNIRVTTALKRDLKVLSAKSSLTVGELLEKMYDHFRSKGSN